MMDVATRSAAALLWARDLESTANDIKQAPGTFSSWDRCMSKNYCKWPAIIGIIIASVVVLSIVWCLVRCMCCGLSCCCDCLSCCNACCPGGRRSRGGGGHRHLDNEAGGGPPPAFGQYGGYRPPPQPTAYEPPRFAQFDVGHGSTKPVHDDALPAMPSWETAQRRQITEQRQHEDEALEMGELDAATSQRMPMLGDVGLAHGAKNPHSPGPAPMMSGYTDNNNSQYQSPNAHPYGSPYGGSPPPLGHPSQQQQQWQNAPTSYDGAGNTAYPQQSPYQPPQYQPQPQQPPSQPADHSRLGAPSYAAYSPYHAQQETGVVGSSSPPGHATPNALTPGRPQQDTWTVV